MSFPIQLVQRHFDRAAASYDEAARLQREVLGQVMELAKAHFPIPGLILDAGCGTGQFNRLAKEQAPGWRVIGLDLAFAMCRAAQSTGQPSVNADAERLPFADESFDGAVLSLTLQWLNNREAFFRELSRMLKPGGKAVITSFGPATLTELKHSFAMLDSYEHVSRFAPLSQLTEEIGRDLAVAHQHAAMLTYHYPSVSALLGSLKAIGATHKQEGRRQGLMGRSVLARMEEAYRTRYGSPHGIPASWEIYYLLLEKH